MPGKYPRQTRANPHYSNTGDRRQDIWDYWGSYTYVEFMFAIFLDYWRKNTSLKITNKKQVKEFENLKTKIFKEEK